MNTKKYSKIGLFKRIFGSFLVFVSMIMFSVGGLMSAPVYAVPEDETITEASTVENSNVQTMNGDNNLENNADGGQQQDDEETGLSSKDSCKKSLGALGWLVCPMTEKIAQATDWLYEKIEDILVIDPIPSEDGAPIYEIWKYCLGFTNIVFIIFLLVVIYSQLTGLGISNYGLKKVLPKLIVTAVMVNLSFWVCQLAVDASNIIGDGLRGLFKSVEENAVFFNSTQAANYTYSGVYKALAGVAAGAAGAGIIAFEFGAIWMLIPVVLGAIVSVVTGLVTVALRQAVVALLIMIAPLALVAQMLPNVEVWYVKWKKLFDRMLMFYPMFSLLFGASSLAGMAIIASAQSGFMVILGMAVQVFPLFFSWSLMKMSGTFLENINAKLRGIAAQPLAINRGWADSHRQLTSQRFLDANRTYMPSVRLRQFVDKRRVSREAQIKEHRERLDTKGLAYRSGQYYRRDGKTLSRMGERDYEALGRTFKYQEAIERQKNDVNLGYALIPGSWRDEAQKKRIIKLDTGVTNAADRLRMEKSRGETIEYTNARNFRTRMEDAMSLHLDETKGYRDGVKRTDYKFHFDDLNSNLANEARERYAAVESIMHGDEMGIGYAAANAAYSYEAQLKMLANRYETYFRMTPATKDVEYRLGELTTRKDAAQLIDAIIPGLRILNQRGDTDLVRAQLRNLLDKDIGGGIELGTHASQSLANFLQQEVRDSDPYLRRFGKYINLQTAYAFNKNIRKELGVDYAEYIKGYHDGEVDFISNDNPTGRMHAKKGLVELIKGTSFDGIERTAMQSFLDSLIEAYADKDENGELSFSDEKLEELLEKKKEVDGASRTAHISASQKFQSGSEQSISLANYKMGYFDYFNKQTGEKEKRSMWRAYEDDNGVQKVFSEDQIKKLKKHYDDQTMDFLLEHTPTELIKMRSDWFNGYTEHMLNLYVRDNAEDRFWDKDWGKDNSDYAKKRKELLNEAMAFLKYDGDFDSLNEDQKKKFIEELLGKGGDDAKDMRMKLAAHQMQVALHNRDKLRHIHQSANTGTALGAKDDARKFLGLNPDYDMQDWGDTFDKVKQGMGAGYVARGGDGSWEIKNLMDNIDRLAAQGGHENDPDAYYQICLNCLQSGAYKDSDVVGEFIDYYKDNKDGFARKRGGGVTDLKTRLYELIIKQEFGNH